MERWWRRRRRKDAGETEERISGDSMRGEPYVEERASQTGPLALLLHGRQAAASQLTAAAHYTEQEGEEERERGAELKQETFREGDRRG